MRPQPEALVAHCLVCGALPKPLSTVLHPPTTPNLRNHPPPSVTLGASNEILKKYLLLFVFVCLVPLGGQSMVPTLTGLNCVEAGVSNPAHVRTDVWA